MTSTWTKIEIRNLANFTTDPQRAGETMIEATKLNVKMTKKVLLVNMLKGLRTRRLGTNQIEMSKDLTEEGNRDEKVVVKLMDIAVKAAEGKAESARRELLRSMRKAKMHLPPGWQRKRFKNIIKEEVEYMWREKSRKNFRKKNHLEAQHKPRKDVDVFEGIAISEKEFLKLPKSATDFVEINEETVNTNIQVRQGSKTMNGTEGTGRQYRRAGC